jgi:hypothetical protein
VRRFIFGARVCPKQTTKKVEVKMPYDELTAGIMQKIGFQRRVVYCRECERSTVEGDKLLCTLYRDLVIFQVFRVSTCNQSLERKKLEVTSPTDTPEPGTTGE